MADLSGLHESAKLYPAVCDFSSKEGVDQLLKVLDEEIKAPLDVVVNNLGIFEAKKFEDITDDEWFKYFNVNVRIASPLHKNSKAHMAMGDANRWMLSAGLIIRSCLACG